MISVTMYSRRGCAFCEEAKTLLESKGASVSQVFIGGATVSTSTMSDREDRQDLPQAFVGQTCIGGLANLKSLEACGRLEAVLDEYS
jgi:glutaredoxin 3